MHKLDSTSLKRFFNRELSWLLFNMRVLKEALNPRYPLMERVRFLSLSGINLLDFYMVRYAALKAQLKSGINLIDDDGKTVAERIKIVREKANEIHQKQDKVFKQLEKELKKNRIAIATIANLCQEEKQYLQEKFVKDILPVLSIIQIKEADKFPLLFNQENCLIVKLRNAKGNIGKAIVPLVADLPRFIKIKPQRQEEDRFIALEEVISLCFPVLFPDSEVEAFGVFYLVRDSIVDFDERSDDLVKGFEQALEKRKRGTVDCLVLEKSMSQELKDFLALQTGVDCDDIVEIDGFIGIKQLTDIKLLKRKDLYFKPYKPKKGKKTKALRKDFFKKLQKKDIVFYHPYEAFDAVLMFLAEAVKNPKVTKIKQTLYRTNKKSPVVQLLKKAAAKGKDVTAVIELRARFDEEANIKWAKDLERAGVKVCFGAKDFKTHAKMMLVTLKNKDGERNFAHFGTGNYNPETAKIYTDISLFTADKSICRDVDKIFAFLTAEKKAEKFKKVSVSPFNLRSKITSLIAKETRNAMQGKKAYIFIKVNSLGDKEIIDALYRASATGVKIDLLVRGVCALRPQVQGLSENIRVKSIVGRFLEHVRLYCFANGGELTDKKAKIFMASADLMYRNLSERIEVMVPVKDKKIRDFLLKEIVQKQIKDKTHSWILNAKMNYKRAFKIKKP